MGKKILIACGGLSSEHDVSVITALQFLEKIDKNKFDCQILYISRENKMYVGKGLDNFNAYRNFDAGKFKEVTFLASDKRLYWVKKRGIAPLYEIDFIVNCCHGGIGENGILSGLFEIAGIDSSSPISASLGICMDKVLSKMSVKNVGVEVVDYIIVDSYSWKFRREIAENKINKFGYPIVVKPSRQGSSVGVVFVKNKDELVHAMNLAFEYDSKIIVEKAITNKREFNCSCLLGSNELLVSEVEEPETSGVILSFEQKYSGGGKGKLSYSGNKMKGMQGLARKFPADISDVLRATIQTYSKRIFSLFELSGVVRIDYIFDVDNQKLYFSEVNTIPGSMSSYFWGKIELFDELYRGSKNYWKNRKKLKNEYSISLLTKK